MRIQVDEITKDVSLIVSDFADEDEVEESKMFWENQISISNKFWALLDGRIRMGPILYLLPTLAFHSTIRGLFLWRCTFGTVKVVGNKLLFWEDHYFRLIANRFFASEIPMTFTPEYFVDQCMRLIQTQEVDSPAWRLRLTVFES